MTSTTLARRRLATPVGELVLVASDQGLRAVLWPDDRPGRVRLDPCADTASHPVLDAAARQLDEYFAGERDTFDLALDPLGTEFQRVVWDALTRIPSGTTLTYGQLATQVGRPGAARAVGAAVGRNPLSVVVPCHRVVGSDGTLTGFAGGLPAKEWLLAHETAVSVPGAGGST
jgi:methylated-DNA-[protein]-cysteine S-methyltransferase